MRISASASASATATGLLLAGCPSAGVSVHEGPRLSPELALVAEGPCPRLSAAAAGERRFLVYGETGYDLHDWEAGERLAAAQTVAELLPEGPHRNHLLATGVPRDARGYHPGALAIGADSRDVPWLLFTDTRYAPRGTGALFVRESAPFELGAEGWRAASSPSPLDLGPIARGLPDVPLADACEDAALTFVPLDHSRAPDGALFVAGRCQDDSHVAYADTTLVVARAAPRAVSWDFARLPRTTRLDGIVNVDVHARSAAEAWLVAYEPFEPVAGRQSYLARFDGETWREEDTGIDEGLMSVSGDAEGHLYLAAGRALYRRDGSGGFSAVALPRLRFTKNEPEKHVHGVEVFPRGDVWIEASYRVQLPSGERGETVEAWASALYSNVPFRLPLYCDARERAEEALVEIDGDAP